MSSELAKSQKPQHQDIDSLSDEDAVENISANGNSVNKKQDGAELLQKEQPTATRGRGRPPKNGISAVHREKRPDPEPRGRGRPPKRGKAKSTVAPTGRGRGRPKKRTQSDSSDDERANNEEATEIITLPKQRGRPKKARNSDQESVDNDDDNLAKGTSSGPGRPKKNTVSDSPGRSNRNEKEVVNAIPEVRGKRGRPPKVKPSTTTSGKPRGRPKAATTEVLSKDDDEEDDSELSADDMGEDKNKSEEDSTKDKYTLEVSSADEG